MSVMDRLKRTLPVVFLLIPIIMLLIYPGQCIDAAKDALNLWFYVVVPSLLPFFILSTLLVARISTLRETPGKRLTRLVFGLPPVSLYALFTGMVSGYPAGARITGEMVRLGALSPQDAARTLPYTLCASPTFLVGTVSVALLNAPGLALLMAVAHFGGAVLCGEFFRVWYGLFVPRLDARRGSAPPPTRDTGLVQAVEGAMKSMLFVGGTMVLFSIFIRQLQLTGLLGWLTGVLGPLLSVLGLEPGLGASLASGVIEMANGCGEAAGTVAPVLDQGAVTLAIVTFGGLSVAAQSAGMLRGTPLGMRHYIFPKLVHTAFALVLYLLLEPILSPAFAQAFWPFFGRLLQNADVPAAALLFSISGTVCFLVLLIFVYNRNKRV